MNKKHKIGDKFIYKTSNEVYKIVNIDNSAYYFEPVRLSRWELANKVHSIRMFDEMWANKDCENYCYIKANKNNKLKLINYKFLND